MKDKIVLFLTATVGILILVVVCMFYANKSLKTEKNALKEELCRKEETIKEMEKINELYLEARKENEKFKERLSDDDSDNLNVRPATYILDQLRKD